MSHYFSRDDHAVLAGDDEAARHAVHIKMTALHSTLHRRIRERNWDLHPHWEKARMITTASDACRSDIQGFAAPFLRSRDHAANVERLMGRDYAAAATETDAFRHPVIELRLTADFLVLEFILNPAAWWDQRNLIGKLSLDRHRHDLRARLARMGDDFSFGFWDGCDLSDTHLTTRQLLRGRVLEDWMSTFSDGQDWLRVGVWYQPENDALSTDNIAAELMTRTTALFELYKFALWTSNNNFQNFYPQATVATSARDKNH